MRGARVSYLRHNRLQSIDTRLRNSIILASVSSMRCANIYDDSRSLLECERNLHPEKLPGSKQ